MVGLGALPPAEASYPNTSVDETGQAIRIPEWIPETEADIKLLDTAKKLMDMRKTIGDEMQLLVD